MIQNKEILKNEVREVLENNILRFWLDRMQDREHGGFYGRIDNQNVLHADADKGAIFNARMLWTFSAAYRVLRKPEYLEAATRGKDYFLSHFMESQGHEEAVLCHRLCHIRPVGICPCYGRPAGPGGGAPPIRLYRGACPGP